MYPTNIQDLIAIRAGNKHAKIAGRRARKAIRRAIKHRQRHEFRQYLQNLQQDERQARREQELAEFLQSQLDMDNYLDEVPVAAAGHQLVSHGAHPDYAICTKGYIQLGRANDPDTIILVRAEDRFCGEVTLSDQYDEGYVGRNELDLWEPETDLGIRSALAA